MDTIHTRDRLAILHIDPEQSWGGGETQVLSLSRYLHQAGHRSVVAADPRGCLYQRLRQENLLCQALRIRNDLDILAGYTLRCLVQADLVHSANPYDLVHFHTARAHALSPWLSGLPIKRVVTRRMDYPLKKGHWTRLLYTHSVDTVVAISHGVQAALLAGGVPETRLRRIPSGVDTECFVFRPETRASMRAHLFQQYGIGLTDSLIISTGALVGRKDSHSLIQAVHHLHKNGLQPHALICGEGPLRASLEAEVQALGLDSYIHFIGFCPDVPAYLTAADMFVHVPVWEGLGVAVIEALAAGLPVIASQVGGIPELIKDQSTGLLIRPQDPIALADALGRLIHTPGFARALGQAGQAHAQEYFDVHAMARANEVLYYELLTDEGDRLTYSHMMKKTSA